MKQQSIQGTWTLTRPTPERTIRRSVQENASQAIAEFEPGTDLCMLTKGRFSLIDLIRALLDKTGPADVTVSTWTAARREIDEASELLRETRIRSIQWLVDFSFCRRQPAYAAQLRERFGDDCIRSTMNHAKFVMIRNDEWSIVVRTSMNLNKNERLEYAEISQDERFADFLAETVREVFEDQPVGGWIEERPRDVKNQFDELGVEVSSFEASSYGSDLRDPMKPGLSPWPTD
ncbi:MAG: hypothetical protein O7A04_03440 [Acidobacteria bacterium]|nr:hypothetical protein [Acidobacteriota bacterium]